LEQIIRPLTKKNKYKNSKACQNIIVASVMNKMTFTFRNASILHVWAVGKYGSASTWNVPLADKEQG